MVKGFHKLLYQQWTRLTREGSCGSWSARPLPLPATRPRRPDSPAPASCLPHLRLPHQPPPPAPTTTSSGRRRPRHRVAHTRHPPRCHHPKFSDVTPPLPPACCLRAAALLVLPPDRLPSPGRGRHPLLCPPADKGPNNQGTLNQACSPPSSTTSSTLTAVPLRPRRHATPSTLPPHPPCSFPALPLISTTWAER
jgi:hypothetical protein